MVSEEEEEVVSDEEGIPTEFYGVDPGKSSENECDSSDEEEEEVEEDFVAGVFIVGEERRKNSTMRKRKSSTRRRRKNSSTRKRRTRRKRKRGKTGEEDGEIAAAGLRDWRSCHCCLQRRLVHCSSGH